MVVVVVECGGQVGNAYTYAVATPSPLRKANLEWGGSAIFGPRPRYSMDGSFLSNFQALHACTEPQVRHLRQHHLPQAATQQRAWAGRH